jgi:hypothetical protein
MKTINTRNNLCIHSMAILALFLSAQYLVHADEKKPAPAKAAPAKPATPPPSHGPVNTSRAPSSTVHATTSTGGGATTNGRGTTTNGRGVTTNNSRTTTANHGPTTNGRGTTTNSVHDPSSKTHNSTSAGHVDKSIPREPTRRPAIHSSENRRERKPLPNGHVVIHSENGGLYTKRSDGRVANVHDQRRGMEIHHGLDRGRRVEVRTRDGHRIVAERGRPGFIERPYRFRDREYGHRTYYYQGRAYDHFYHGYYYRGAFVQMYTPAYYYAPAFYGWAYNPWVAPVPYAWGWEGAPWYGYYGVYFAPYPVYPSASYWLTDYLISTTLAAAYEARIAEAAQAQAQAQHPDAVVLTPQVKDLISAEVQRQIAIENAESRPDAQNADPDPAMSGVQALLNDNIHHVFVAGRSIDVTDASGAECAISEGDAIQLTGPPPAGATSATLVVLSSKGGQECRAGGTVTVEVADLQDMQNHMRETIDQGMNELQSKQGKGGLPALPASAKAPPTKAAFAADAPGPDASAANEIAEQSKEADIAEKEVVAQADSGPGPSAPDGQSQAAVAPVPFAALGKGIPEVISHYGQPTNIVDLGAKKIYVYKDLKITFKDDKVIDVQ